MTIVEEDTMLNGAYELGSDPWDTGYCTTCGARLSHVEQVDAILNMINYGDGYWCDNDMHQLDTIRWRAF